MAHHSFTIRERKYFKKLPQPATACQIWPVLVPSGAVSSPQFPSGVAEVFHGKTKKSAFVHFLFLTFSGDWF
jgi:hypothetical protein